MPEEKQAQGTGAPDAGSQQQQQQSEPDLSNRDVKAHPLFQKLTQEISELRKFKETADAAAAEQARKAAEAEKDYAKATQLAVDKALSDARRTWDAEQATKDARSEARYQLMKVGFKNEKFITGLLADFDPAKSSAEDFAKAAAADKENADFLSSAKPAPKNPDPQNPTIGTRGKLSDDEIQKLRESQKPEDRAKAFAESRAKWIAENQGKAV